MNIDPRKILRQAVDKYLTEARESGLGIAGAGLVRGPLLAAFDLIDAFDGARERINADPELSDSAKKTNIAKLEATTRAAVLGEVETARRRLGQERAHHEAKTKLPRVEGADLMAARHDLDRLTSGVKAGDLAERLRFAAQNGGDAVRDLLLGGNYGEAVILPAAGPDFAVDAARWADTKQRLVAEHLGPAGEPHMKALTAVQTAAKAITLAEHAAASAFPTEEAPA